jgi:hypothetical protein
MREFRQEAPRRSTTLVRGRRQGSFLIHQFLLGLKIEFLVLAFRLSGSLPDLISPTDDVHLFGVRHSNSPRLED